jgi:hypothetical protein
LVSLGSFRLAAAIGGGVSCSEEGLFVGEIALLERVRGSNGSWRWRPRDLPHINRDLSKCYGLPIEFDQKFAGLELISNALNRSEFGRAQIAALHLRLPDPPVIAKSAQNRLEVVQVARRLQASGLLKAGWDSSKHPRWPAESPDGVGGQFAPVGDESGSGGESARLIPAQVAVPVPFESPLPGAIPLPPEIVFPPIVTPNITPREAPSNPYPDRPECVEEWASAYEYCRRLKREGKLGRDGYRGAGNSISQCVRGQVSQDCGGNILEA